MPNAKAEMQRLLVAYHVKQEIMIPKEKGLTNKRRLRKIERCITILSKKVYNREYHDDESLKLVNTALLNLKYLSENLPSK